MPDFSSWGDLPSSPVDSPITSEVIHSVLGPSASPPFFARLLGFNTDRKVNAVRYSVQRSQEALVDRSLTPTEIEALAHYASAEGDTGANNQAIVSVAALAVTLWGRKKMTFPIWKPKDMMVFKTFPSTTMPWLRGRNAKRAWHVARYSAYYVASTVTLGLFLTNLSTRSALTNKAVDPRLRDYLRETILDPQNQSIILALQKERGVPQIEFRRQDDPFVINAREVRRNRFYENVEKKMTPAQREKVEERRRRAEKSQSEWRERVGGANQQQSSPVQSSESVWAQHRNGVPSVSAGTPREQDNDDPFAVDDDEEDDMSPVPAHIRRQEQQAQKMREAARLKQQQAMEQGGSVWERLRAGAMAGEGQTEQWTGNSGNAGNDSNPAGWGAVEGEKSQSHKEFDTLIETERRGQSNNSKWD